MTRTETTTSLLERLGGTSAVQALVEVLCARLQRDPALAPYFEGSDTKRLRREQEAFLSEMFGAKKPDAGLRSVRAGLSPLGFRAEQFDRTFQHLCATLAHLGVAPELVDEVVAVLD